MMNCATQLTSTSYFRHFHPDLPLLTTRDPNTCYDASHLLFWAIILISTRRRHQSSANTATPATSIVRLLSEYIKATTDSTITRVPLSLPQIQAILLIAAWALYPGARFINDPALWLMSTATNSCLLLGLHTGRGTHAEFSHVGVAGSRISDHEASVTWVACCILSLR